MTVFADTSAVVKRYAEESGSEQVRGQGTVVVSALARVEVVAALWRKHRMGELTVEDDEDLVLIVMLVPVDGADPLRNLEQASVRLTDHGL